MEAQQKNKSIKLPQTVEVSIDSMQENANNPRHITTENMELLVKSILTLPKMLYLRPIVADDRNTPLGGNMRVQALKNIKGMEFEGAAKILEGTVKFQKLDDARRQDLLAYWQAWMMRPVVPVLYASTLAPDEIQEFIIKDNTAYGDWDLEALANNFDLEELCEIDPELLTQTDIDALGTDAGDGDNPESRYTKKIMAPIYEPSNEKPGIAELYDDTRRNALVEQIESAEVSDDEKRFLREAAARHTVFNYEKIADYYAHAPLITQGLMEQSALVIIDFKKAIENGYLRLADDVKQQYLKECENEEK
jgi:parB domain protein nuclease